MTTDETLRLSLLSQNLLVCNTETEVLRVAEDHLARRRIVALYLLNETTGQMEPCLGAVDAGSSSAFLPTDCIAARTGKVCKSTGGALECLHSRLQDDAVCIPVVADGRVAGVLHVVLSGEEGLLFQFAAEAVGMALSNVRRSERLRQTSLKDPLTGLWNYRFLMDALTIDLARAVRQQNTVAILMLDFDRFKPLNDRFGHEEGDRFLRSAGDCIRSKTRLGDYAARRGGDEFTVVLAEADRATIRARADDLRGALLNVPQIPDAERVTVSIGLLVIRPRTATTPAEALAMADAALYEAKEAGRNRMRSVTVAFARDYSEQGDVQFRKSGNAPYGAFKSCGASSNGT